MTSGEQQRPRDEWDRLTAENARLRKRVAELEALDERRISTAVSTHVGRIELFSAVEKTRMPMILTDPNQPDDPIVFANRAFQELSGYNSAELVGRNCRFLQGTATDRTQVGRVREALDHNRDIAVEIVNYRRDGTPFLNELFISSVFDETGALLYHFGSQLDVTNYRHDRRELERMLRRDRTLFERTNAFAVVVTDCAGRITDWNSGAERLMGWSAVEVQGHSAEMFFTPEDCTGARLHADMERALRDGYAGNACWRLRKDGSRFFASGELLPLHDADDSHIGFVKILRDRTAEHEASVKLEEAQLQLRRAQQVGRIGLFWVDLATDTIHATPDYCGLYGLPESELLPADKIEQLTFAADRAAVFTRDRRRRGELPVDNEYRINRADTGEERWIARKAEFERNEAGQPVRLVGVALDVTDTVLARRQLADEQEQLAQFFEQAPIIMGLLRGADHRIERANPGFLALIGNGAAVGRPFAEAVPGGDLGGFVGKLDIVWSTGQPFVGTRRIGGRDGADQGDERFIDLVFQPLRDAAGGVAGILVQGVDVTDRTLATAKLRRDKQHQQMLLDLADKHRDLTDPAAIGETAAAMLASLLGVTRVGYGTVDTASETITIETEWTAPGVAPLQRSLRFRDYGSYIEDVKRGTTVVIADAREDARTRATADALIAIEASAFVNMPLVEHGRFVAMFFVTHLEPRMWPDADLRLMREVGERVRLATERLRNEHALRDSEEQFRVLAQAVPNHIWSCQPDGRFDFVNAQLESYCGTVPSGVAATFLAFVHPDDRPGALHAWRDAMAAGAVFETQARLRRRDGDHRWFLMRGEPVRDGAGRIVRWVGTSTDIDEQRRHALDLSLQNANLGEVVEERTRERDRIWQATTDMLCVATMAGYFVSLNRAWTVTLGWTEGELQAVPFLDFVHPDDRASTIAAAAGLAEGEAIPIFENRYRHKDGTYRWFSWNAVPSDGLIYATVRDITASKAQAEALAAAEEALRQAQKMEAVGQLTGGLAHDFNNLLTGITGSLDLMSTRIAQGRFKDLERYAAAAQGAARRAASLTHRLLAFSRRQTLDPRPTDVNRLVAGMEDLVRRTVGPAVTVETVFAGGLWPTLVDPNQLENALLNLCINARDAMAEGGRLTIETSNRWLDQRAARDRELPVGQYVSLCVTDTGSGMTPEVIAKAFDPFFTTKPLGQGTGLGLSMIYGFARQSGGQVRIYSEPGDGTIVCVYLPRHLGEAEQPEVPAELGSAPRAGAGETVLVVDDEPTVRMLVADVLEDLGYAAIEAADGAAGLRALQTDVRIDLLITDVGLPGGMNGRQFAEAALALRPGLTVLFITGFAENAVFGNGQLPHGFNVMTKPFTMEAMATRIKELIDGR